MMMFISVIPLLIVQIPQILDSILWRHIAVLIGLIASLLLFVSYSTYQVSVPIYSYIVFAGWLMVIQFYFSHQHFLFSYRQIILSDQICLIMWKFGKKNFNLIFQILLLNLYCSWFQFMLWNMSLISKLFYQYLDC